MRPSVDGSSLLFLLNLLSVCLVEEEDNYFHHLYDTDEVPGLDNSPDEIFNNSRGIIFVNNPDLLKSQQTTGLHDPSTSVSRSSPGTSIPGKAKDNFHIQESAATLGLYLRGISNKELSTPVLHSVLEQLPYDLLTNDDSVTAKEVASSITSKIEKYSNILRNIHHLLQDSYSSYHDSKFRFQSCCNIPHAQFKHDSKFGVSIKSSLSCDASKIIEDFGSSFPQTNLSQIFKKNLASSPGLRWQYVLTTSGQEIIHPAYLNPSGVCTVPSRGDVFLQTLHRESKNVVFILDISSRMSSHQFRLGLETLLHMVSSLSASDRGTIVLLSSSSKVVDVRPKASCLMGRLLHFSESVKSDIVKYLFNLIQDGTTADFAIGTESIVNILSNSDLRINDHAQIIVISRSNENEDKIEFSNMITKFYLWRKRFKFSTALSFILIQNIGQTVVPGVQMLVKLLSQDEDSSVVLGKIHLINSSSRIQLGLNDWYSVSNPTVGDKIVVFSPKLDSVSGSMTITLSQTIRSSNKVVAIAGLEFAWDDMVEEIVWRPREEGTRVFLIDISGKVIAHQSLTTVDPIANHVHIEFIESALANDSAIRKILGDPNGSLITSNTNFTWLKVDGAPYIVVIASNIHRDNVQTRLGQLPHYTHTNFQYHGLILAGTNKLCRHLRDVASMQTAALYLSPSAFASPSEQLSSDYLPLRTQSYMAYLTDHTRLIANPGLRVGVRNDAQIIAQLVDLWKEQAYSSPLNNYIVRRRVATPKGVMLSYPGAPVPSGTDPTSSSWYRAGVELPGKLVVSPPTLDTGGAGYIVTVSHAVYSEIDETNKTIAAVVSADFTQGYFYKIINDTIRGQICAFKNMTCFLLDHHGYLVAHPNLNENGPRQHVFSPPHLTHLEPLVATDLLSDVHDTFMKKTICRSLKDQSLQRKFILDMDHTGVVISRGEQCSQYSIAPIPGTNLFLGVINKTCNTATAFCWCSTVDRTCLDCSRMSQDECECPCECKKSLEPICAANKEEYSVPTCSPEPQKISRPRFSTVRVDHLPPCIHTDCQSRLSESDCYGVLGCSWCHTDQDSITPLTKPFCSYQEKCYSGILSYPSPYSLVYDQSRRSLESDSERPLFRASPIGPVAGGIMAFFLLLAITAWAYRHWSSGDRRMLLNSGDQDTLRIDQLEEEHMDDLCGPRSGHQNYGLHGGDLNGTITVVSPYRMNPGYRRPRPAPGTDSDHGYSTMTPYGDQDSEIMSCLGDSKELPSVNIQSRRERFRSRNPISLQSVTSGVSSRASSPPIELNSYTQEESSNSKTVLTGESECEGGRIEDEGKTLISETSKTPNMTTVLPLGKNQMIVAATVHMVDT